MGLTVFAEGLGLFHKGSGGKGVAPGDVCLTPPPPPAGPLPVPYVNLVQASDLADGSTTVTIDGEPTALSDKSSLGTSSGDEAGTQGGNVVTHKTKGKGYFSSWSTTVTVEGEGVCRHSDLLGQACASKPFGIVDPSAVTSVLAAMAPDKMGQPCPPGKENAPQTHTNERQRESVRGGPCWSCGATENKGVYKSGRPFNKKDRFVADHQPPQSSVWAMGGCHDEKAFNEWKKSEAAVVPHCSNCSNSQGTVMRGAQGKSVLEYLCLGLGRLRRAVARDGDPYAQLFGAYLVELRTAREQALDWWSKLLDEEAARLSSAEQAIASLRARWPLGPVAHPRVIAVYRRYHLAIDDVNARRIEALEQAETAPDPFDADAWLSEPGDRMVVQQPRHVLYERLDEADPVLARFMDRMLFIPVGMDAQGRLA